MEGHSVISPEVLARYAVDAAAEVPGVHPTKQRRGARVTGGRGRGAHRRRLRRQHPRLSRPQVQRRGRDYLQRMADVTPRRVDVVVDDVAR